MLWSCHHATWKSKQCSNEHFFPSGVVIQPQDGGKLCQSAGRCLMTLTGAMEGGGGNGGSDWYVLEETSARCIESSITQQSYSRPEVIDSQLRQRQTFLQRPAPL